MKIDCPRNADKNTDNSVLCVFVFETFLTFSWEFG